MEKTLNSINKLMVNVFNDIQKIEENTLKSGRFKDISVTEMHTIEAIGLHKEIPMSEIAKRLSITVGTLTVAINNLVKKDYVKRSKCEQDRRLVLIKLTKRGRVVFRLHAKFHKEMVNSAVDGLNESQRAVLVTALSNLHDFLIK